MLTTRLATLPTNPALTLLTLRTLLTRAPSSPPAIVTKWRAPETRSIKTATACAADLNPNPWAACTPLASPPCTPPRTPRPHASRCTPSHPRASPYRCVALVARPSVRGRSSVPPTRLPPRPRGRVTPWAAPRARKSSSRPPTHLQSRPASRQRQKAAAAAEPTHL